jgi:uncharacterized Zn finger protein
MCKHIAATLYGVGALLDEAPEHLFQLRQVDHTDLITEASVETLGSGAASGIDEANLSTLFGIDIDAPTADKKVEEPTPGSELKKPVRRKSSKLPKKTQSKKSVRQKKSLRTDSSKPKKTGRRKKGPSLGFTASR